jgi:hypothetical protein
VLRWSHIGAAERCGQREARQFEKRAAGAPIREGAAFATAAADHSAAHTIPYWRAEHPSRSGHRQALAGGAFFRA